MSQYLNDPDYLFSLLTALVKKSGGTIKITKEELSSVTKGDLLGMYYEPKTDAIILKKVDPKDMMQATNMVRDKKEDNYEN